MRKINLETLLLFDNIRKDEIINGAVKIFNEFLYRDYIAYMEPDYYAVQRMLLNQTQSEDIEGSYWQNYICRLVAESENRFSLDSESGRKDPRVLALAVKELEEIKELFHLDWNKIASVFGDAGTAVSSMICRADGSHGRNQISQALLAEDLNASVEQLYQYYHQYCSGPFEQYQAFLWNGELVGIQDFDAVSFDHLIGYARQKAALIENTEFFLQGLPANNALLYGDKGTGKSSCIKALIRRFSDQNLKIIELSKEDMSDLYKILGKISKRGCKFILFVDDLSFDETELGYKQFKSILEGGVEAQPANVVVYVTSNRRNLVKENWSDRSGSAGEVNLHDGIQERQSLADRFGLTITFLSPDQQAYLEIVRGLAEQKGLFLDDHDLVREAEKWELKHHGRSGRSARQFVNYIAAKTQRSKPE